MWATTDDAVQDFDSSGGQSFSFTESEEITAMVGQDFSFDPTLTFDVFGTGLEDNVRGEYYYASADASATLLLSVTSLDP